MRPTSVRTLLAPIAAGGCVDQDEAADAAAPSGGDEVLQRTIVTMNDDGTTSVQQSSITRAQQLAHRADDVSDPVDSYPDCPSQTVQLFDNVDFTGNELCLWAPYGGTADLGKYHRTLHQGTAWVSLPWAGAVRSFHSNPNRGRFSGPGGSEDFGFWTTASVVDAPVAQATTLLLTGIP
jgi:hypothetical protein